VKVGYYPSIELSLCCTKLIESELYSCRLGNRFPRTRSDILDFNCYGSRRLDFEFQRSCPRDSSSHSSSSRPHSDRRIDSTRCTRSNCCRSPLDRQNLGRSTSKNECDFSRRSGSATRYRGQIRSIEFHGSYEEVEGWRSCS